MAETREARGKRGVGASATPHDAAGNSEGIATAKLFMHGRSQAVRLPKEFRFPGREVRIRRVESGVLLQPVEWDPKTWLAKLDSYGDEPFLPEGIPKAPPMPEDLFEE